MRKAADFMGKSIIKDFGKRSRAGEEIIYRAREVFPESENSFFEMYLEKTRKIHKDLEKDKKIFYKFYKNKNGVSKLKKPTDIFFKNLSENLKKIEEAAIFGMSKKLEKEEDIIHLEDIIRVFYKEMMLEYAYFATIINTLPEDQEEWVYSSRISESLDFVMKGYQVK